MNAADSAMRDAESRAEKAEAYDKWFGKPETKLMISLLPGLETDLHRDAFATILLSAFDADHHSGTADMLKTILTGMGMPRPDGTFTRRS